MSRLLLLVALVSGGCTDDGPLETAASVPAIDALVPARTVVADTVAVEGTGFGASAFVSSVRFTSAGGTVGAVVVDWSEERVRALVPPEAIDGAVTVETPAGTSDGVDFALAPALVAYSQVDAIFENRGCKGCHGGNGGLSVQSREDLLRGDSTNGPVVRRRRSPASALVQKLGPAPPFGQRMPQNGPPFLTDAEILTVADWIDQGTRAD